MIFTVLFCNASTRYCTPWSPIQLHPRLRLVNVYLQSQSIQEGGQNMRVTVLFRTASARCWTPWSPIWLHSRLRLVRLYLVKKRIMITRMTKDRIITVLFRSASARCWAPDGLIRLFPRLMMVKVCWKNIQMHKNKTKKEHVNHRILSQYISKILCSLVSYMITSKIKIDQRLFSKRSDEDERD